MYLIMSMALSALGYSKNAAGSFVKVASVAPDKTGDFLIFLGTKLKGMAAGMNVSGENLKLSGTIDLMVSRGEITGDEVTMFAEAKGIGADEALKAIALQKLAGKVIEQNNSKDDNSVVTTTAAVEQVSVASKDGIMVTANSGTVAAPVTGPTVIPIKPEKKSEGVMAAEEVVAAADSGVQEKVSKGSGVSEVQVSMAADKKDSVAAGVNSSEEIPAHVLALELC